MLHLENHLLVGRGTERLCYRHPHNSELCVKVTHNHKNDKQQNVKDYHYYRKLEKRGIDWSHLPRCHGWVETSLGLGLVFDLLQDTEGKPLQSITHIMADQRIDYSDLEEPLEQLKNYLKNNIIFTSDLRENNIVCLIKNGKPSHLYIIDGLGDRDFIKLAAVLPPLGKAKVDRQWRRFMKRMREWHK